MAANQPYPVTITLRTRHYQPRGWRRADGRDRTIVVRCRAERWEAQTVIAGRLSALRRIWVQAEGGVLGPTVKFVEVTGVDVESGRVRTERIQSH